MKTFPNDLIDADARYTTQLDEETGCWIDKDFVGGGLTKREWFAGLAMQSICQDRTAIYNIRSIAKGAVDYADALIEALNNEKTGL